MRRLLGLGLVVLGVVVMIGLAIGSLTRDDEGAGDKKASVAAEKKFPGATTPDGGRLVKRSDYGDKWPLTIDGGTLRCSEGAVTLETPEKTYALNPEAQSRALGESLAPVWAPNPAIEGARMSTGALIESGLALC